MFHLDLLQYISSLFLFSSSLYQVNSTPLWAAAANGRTEVVIVLLDRGANIEAKDKVSENDE